MSPSASDGMTGGAAGRQRDYGVALPASVGVHIALILILIFGLPLPKFETPPEEQAVQVDLVPPPGEEEKKAEAEQPPPPQQPEPKPQPEQPAQQQAQPPPPQVLQPVQRFGEEDAGPRQSRGNAAEEGEQAERTQPQQPEQQPVPAEQPAQPEALTANQSEQQAAQGEAQEPVIEPPTLPARETPKEETPEAEKPPAEDAGALDSRAETGVTIATTAMNDLPRGVRAGRLCVSELRERMLNSVPPYFPDLLPSFRLDEGTVLDAGRAAFRMGGEWYDLKYRCEIDDEATRVRSFAFEVGGRLSQAERQRRGIPVR